MADALGGARAYLVARNVAPGGPAPGAGPIAATPSLYSAPITLAGVGAGAGYGTWQRGIPNVPALVGQRMWFRWLVLDPAAPRGFARSRWAELTLR